MSDADPDVVTKQVQIDLELNATAKEDGNNRFQVIIDAARAVDAWRIFPRIFIMVYIYLLYKSVIWFMALPDPNTQQASLISVVTGIGAAWFGLYVRSGPGKNKKED